MAQLSTLGGLHTFMSYRNIITLFAVVATMLGFVSGCASNKNVSVGDTVRVVDGVSGKPISGASVIVIYPSGAGTPFKTDKHGIAHIQGGFGRKEDGIHIQALVPGGPTAAIGLWGVATNYVEIKIGPFKK